MSHSLLFVVVAQVAADTCGDGNGEQCGSWFSKFKCPGTCCHDDFNTWCCPAGPWKCSGSFGGESPGSGLLGSTKSHCDDADNCKCTDTTYYITKVEAAGTPTIKADPAWDLSECCKSDTATQCGFLDGTSISWTQSQSMSWSNSLQVTETVTFKESLLVEGVTASISLADTFTQSSTKSSTLQQTIDSPCGGSYAGTTFVHFKANVALYTVPVTLTYNHCGISTTAPGTVSSSVLNARYSCDVEKCKSGVCDENAGCSGSLV